ncbi:MAG: Smr/MutS family protein [Desulfatibacillaceae bacterium]
MPRDEQQGVNRPFEGLASIMKEKKARKRAEAATTAPEPALRQPGPARRVPPPPSSPPDPVEEDSMFNSWMSGVMPIERGNHEMEGLEPEDEAPRSAPARDDSDARARAMLEELVAGGAGFVIHHTAEYVEGSGYGVHPAMARRLHEGAYSIQDHLDLHGMDGEQAEAAFNQFVRESLDAGRRAVVVIHGRGLSSPGEPVLKSRVLYWLTKGAWRKWVIAFASARWCDGGTGATYVLFRNRPVTASQKKRGWGGIKRL